MDKNKSEKPEAPKPDALEEATAGPSQAQEDDANMPFFIRRNAIIMEMYYPKGDGKANKLAAAWNDLRKFREQQESQGLSQEIEKGDKPVAATVGNEDDTKGALALPGPSSAVAGPSMPHPPPDPKESSEDDDKERGHNRGLRPNIKVMVFEEIMGPITYEMHLRIQRGESEDRETREAKGSVTEFTTQNAPVARRLIPKVDALYEEEDGSRPLQLHRDLHDPNDYDDLSEADEEAFRELHEAYKKFDPHHLYVADDDDDNPDD